MMATPPALANFLSIIFRTRREEILNRNQDVLRFLKENGVNL